MPWGAPATNSSQTSCGSDERSCHGPIAPDAFTSRRRRCGLWAYAPLIACRSADFLGLGMGAFRNDETWTRTRDWVNGLIGSACRMFTSPPTVVADRIASRIETSAWLLALLLE